MKNCEEFVRFVTSKGFREKQDKYLRDEWGREFKWETARQGKEVRIRVLSAGPNGRFENGGGDDILVEVTYTGKMDVRVTMKGLITGGGG